MTNPIADALSDNKIFTLFNLEAFANNCHKTLNSSLIGYKTLWEKEKIQVTSIFPLFLQCFQKAFYLGIESRRCVV